MAIRIVGALLILVAGYLHLKYWRSDYRHIPSSVPGSWVVSKGFLVNTATSAIVGIGLLVTALIPMNRIAFVAPVPPAIGLLLEASSLAVLLISAGPGFFGWTEQLSGAHPKNVLFVEIIAVVLLAADLVTTLATYGGMPNPTSVAT